MPEEETRDQLVKLVTGMPMPPFSFFSDSYRSSNGSSLNFQYSPDDRFDTSLTERKLPSSDRSDVNDARVTSCFPGLVKNKGLRETPTRKQPKRQNESFSAKIEYERVHKTTTRNFEISKVVKAQKKYSSKSLTFEKVNRKLSSLKRIFVKYIFWCIIPREGWGNAKTFGFGRLKGG